MTTLLSMMRRAAFFWVALLFVAMPLGGCRGSNRRSVAVIPRISSDARWLSFHVGIEEAAQKAGLEAHWSGPNDESNPIEQIELADEAIAQRAYGIILEPSSLIATNRVIRKAQSERIPVVIISESAETPEGEHLYRIQNDTAETGNLIANRVAQFVQGDGQVAILGLRTETPGNIERSDAIAEALRRQCPNLQIIKKSMESSSISYEQREVGEFVRTHPRVKAIVSLSSAENFAVVAAVRAEHATERIKIIGCDQTLAELLMLRAGAIDSLVVQDMRRMGSQAIQIIARDRQGIYPPAVTITKPVLVSAENIDSEAVQHIIQMHRESLP